MLSRLNASNPWTLSVLLHAGLAVVAVMGFMIASFSPRVNFDSVDFKVVEVTKKAEDAPYAIKPRTEVIPNPQKKARAVFGANRKSILSSEASAVAVKPGNTLAKEADNETLRDDDPNSLPAPVDEFLVNEMPSVLSEVRIPYPEEAKKKGIQGAVVMDLLIDAEGKVREAKLLKGLGGGLEEAALNAVKNFKFRPAMVQGKSVTVRIRYAYRFVLEN